MSETSPTISIRLPLETRRSLDRVAKATLRSRSFLMKEALGRYLDEIAQEETPKTARKLSHLRRFAGAGKDIGKPRSAEEVISDIRWLRDSD